MRVIRALVALTTAILGISITVGASGASFAQFTSISAGGGHACVLTGEGGVKCWGSNRFGQIGNGVNRKCNQYGKCTKPVSRRPADVVGLARGVRAIAAGGTHTCALTSLGGVKCWGYNASGQLGNGQKPCDDPNRCAKNASSRPVDVVGLRSGVKAIAAGDFHTCALMNGGAVKCWGDNLNGQLGTRTAEWRRDRSTPVDVVGLSSGVSAIAAGAQVSCAVTPQSEAKCWGAESPLAVAARGVTAIAIGSYADNAHTFLDHICALTTGGGVKCWGSNQSGQLGNGVPRTGSDTPVDIAGLTSGVRAIVAGGSFTCALTSAGGVKCWGRNHFGTLGDGTTTDRNAPVDVAGLSSGVIAISAGAYHACALPSKGGVKCWGWNYAGTLGNGSKAGRSTKPVDVLFSVEPIVKPPSSSTAGRCSKATTVKVATRLNVGVDPVIGKTAIFQVLCGPFLGRASQGMVASVAVPTGCGGSTQWAVFRFIGSAWQLVMQRPNGAFLSKVGASDIRERVGAPRPGDPRCSPSAWKTRIWHWNGSRLVAGRWKQVTKGEHEARGFDSPSLNINCGMFDQSGGRYVRCQSRVPPQTVTMDAGGQLSICRDRTPNDTNNDCNLGDRGEGPIQPLAYGGKIIVGRFLCLAMEIGVRCTVIRSGKGFLISRDGVSRVGP